MKRFYIFCFILLLTACGGGSSAPVSEPVVSKIRPFYNEFQRTDGLDIVAIYGQSNAVGLGFTESLLSNESNTSNMMSQKCVIDGVLEINEDCFVTNSISDPSDLYRKGLFSSWIDFDRSLYANASRKIHLVNAAVGATEISQLLTGAEGLSSPNGIDEYTNLINGIKHSLEIYGVDNINTVSVIWLQGESDAIRIVDDSLDYDAAASVYFESLGELRLSMLSDLNIPKLEIFVVRLGDVAGPFLKYSPIQNDLGFWQIRYSEEHEGFTAISLLPRTYNQTNLLLSSDGIHYSKLGYELLGLELADNFLKYLDKDDSFKEELSELNQKYPPNIIKEKPF